MGVIRERSLLSKINRYFWMVAMGMVWRGIVVRSGRVSEVGLLE